MTDLSGNSETITLDITSQVAEQEKRRNQWLSDKADILLASDNRKELVIGLIEDFNKMINATKFLEKIARTGVSRKTSSGLRSSLVEIIQFFDAQYQYKE